MKLTVFLILLGLLRVGATGYAQVYRVSLDMENAACGKVIQSIKRQTSLDFFFSNKELNVDRKISVSCKDAILEDVLKQILGEGYHFRIVDHTVVIRPVLASLPQAKQMTIKGVVRDSKGAELPGVTVLLKGTTIGTSTDVDGKFSITLPEVEGSVPIFIFSFIGMKNIEVKYTGQPELKVVMQEDATEMEEVVVTGMFNKAKESFTGAVSVITEKELKTFGNRNLLTTLANIDPSFNILADNISGSNPNSLPNVQIRGTSSLPGSVEDLKEQNRDNLNTPLIVLDGFEISLEKMMDLNENEVSSITILKDAAATALYGSRAANGVVVITTKQPEEGKLRVTYRGDLTIEAPDLTEYRLLNAREKLDLEYKAGYYTKSDFGGEATLNALYNRRLSEVERGVDTYWLSKPLRTSYGQRHYIKLEGGSSSFKYGAGLQFRNTPGVMKQSERNNVVGEITLSYTYKNVIFRNNLSVTFNNAENSLYGSFSTYTKVNPYFRPYDENGDLYKTFPDDIQVNPLYNANIGGRNDSEYTDITNNFSIEWKPIKGLILRGQAGFVRKKDESNVFKPAEHTDFKNYTGDDVMRKGSYNLKTGSLNRYEMRLNGSYNKLFAEKHSLYAGLNVSFSQSKDYSYSVNAEGFPNADLGFFGAALSYEKNKSPSGSESIARAVGFTGNLNYSYDSRYFVDGSVRLDGSSKFGATNRFAPFWSVGAGWNLHNEQFFEGVNFIDRLKFRFSYGVTGSQNFPAYQAMMTYKYEMGDRYGNFTGAYLMGLGNEDLKWQMTKASNLGIELGLLKNRMSLIVDIYRKTTDNLLTDMDLPYSNGFKNYKDNVGMVRNEGVELSVIGFLIRDTERKISWSLTGNLTTNRNKIIEISQALKNANAEIEKKTGSNPNFLFREGNSMSTIYAVRSQGIDPATGKELYLNRFGEVTYTWDSQDQVNCGDSQPKFRGNVSTAVRFGGLTFNTSFGYQWGGRKYNSTLIDKVENADYRSNVDRRVYDDRWMNPGDKTFFKGVKETTSTKATSRFVQDERVFQCQNINVRYEFGEIKWVKEKMKMQALNMSFDASNIFYLSSIKQERGIGYPFSRQFSVTLAATF